MIKHKIVCMGDSLTEGYQIQPRTCWPYLLNKEENLEVINSGICGDTTAGMLARFLPEVIDHQPDFVIIMGGANDLWFNTPNSQIIANIMAMTRHARHHQIQSIIGIPTPYYLPENVDSERFFTDLKSMHNRLLSYDQDLRNFIREDDQPFIDFRQNMSPGLFLEDGIHPNEKGHKLMAEQALTKLETIWAKT